MPEQLPAIWPLVLYFLAVVGMVGIVMVLSHVLGQRHRDRATGTPYESGMIPTGSARLRLSADFYLIAMFFVIFDLESIFIFAWAVAAREAGWVGYLEALVFVAVLFAALAYLWRSGALDWSASGGADSPLNLNPQASTFGRVRSSSVPLYRPGSPESRPPPVVPSRPYGKLDGGRTSP